MPKLSILIPTFNSEKFIKNTISSIQNQKFENYEVICSDNASEDKTFSILQQYSRKDDRIKIYRNERNIGPVLNWKKCLDHAQGEYVHWLWSDDWIEPNFYLDSFELMKNDRTRALSTWNYRNDNINDQNDKYISWQFSYPKVCSKIAAKKVLLSKRELPVSPAAYILPLDSVKKNFFMSIPKISDAIDPVSSGVGVDSLMVIGTCMELNEISILQKPSVVFRKHENISTIISKEGNLHNMYLISHIWYLSKNDVKISFVDALRVNYWLLKLFKKKLFSLNLISVFLSLNFRIILNFGKYKNEDDYISKKVVMN